MQVMNITQTPNIQNTRQLKQSPVAFTGTMSGMANVAKASVNKGFDKFIIGGLAKAMEWSLATPPLKAAVKYLSNNKNMAKMKNILPTVAATVISGLYVTKTMSSKSIEPERKPTLIANLSIVWLLSTVVSLTVNKKLFNDILPGVKRKFAKKADQSFDMLKDALKNNLINQKQFDKGAKDLETMKKGVFGAAALAVTSTVFRFLGPVAAVPLATKAVGMVEDFKAQKKA